MYIGNRLSRSSVILRCNIQSAAYVYGVGLSPKQNLACYLG